MDMGTLGAITVSVEILALAYKLRVGTRTLPMLEQSREVPRSPREFLSQRFQRRKSNFDQSGEDKKLYHRRTNGSSFTSCAG